MTPRILVLRVMKLECSFINIRCVMLGCTLVLLGVLTDLYSSLLWHKNATFSIDAKKIQSEMRGNSWYQRETRFLLWPEKMLHGSANGTLRHGRQTFTGSAWTLGFQCEQNFVPKTVKSFQHCPLWSSIAMMTLQCVIEAEKCFFPMHLQLLSPLLRSCIVRQCEDDWTWFASLTDKSVFLLIQNQFPALVEVNVTQTQRKVWKEKNKPDWKFPSRSVSWNEAICFHKFWRRDFVAEVFVWGCSVVFNCMSAARERPCAKVRTKNWEDRVQTKAPDRSNPTPRNFSIKSSNFEQETKAKKWDDLVGEKLEVRDTGPSSCWSKSWIYIWSWTPLAQLSSVHLESYKVDLDESRFVCCEHQSRLWQSTVQRGLMPWPGILVGPPCYVLWDWLSRSLFLVVVYSIHFY